ncbi:MAG: hypothetical protein WA765_17380 [Candidatus Acidiferrum sp.]
MKRANLSLMGWCLAALAFGVAGKPCLAQETTVVSHVDGAEVRLETEDGRTQFKLDEPMRLVLVFTGHTTEFAVNTTLYGDMSEQVNITPAEGWFRSHGSSGHDYLTTTELADEPIQVPLLLNQGIVFEKPGQYEISITTGRLIGTQAGFAGTRLTTNTVAIEVTAPDEHEEAALVRSLSNQLETGDGQARREAAMQLAYLGGDDAVRAKVRWLLDPGNSQGENLQQEMLEGLASSRNLKLQLDLLEAAWLDVQRVPQPTLLEAIQQTRTFLRKETLDGWSMMVVPTKTDAASKLADQERQNDISALVATLPQRTGDNRRDTAYFLMEFNGLSEAEKALVRPAVLAEFGQMEPLAQAMLLETRWKDIRDPSLVPDLEAMLDAPDELSAHRDALQRLIELSPETGKPYAVREICDPKSEVMLEQITDLPEETLPEVDGCLAAQLSASKESHNPRWQWKVMIATRFGSKGMLPTMREIYSTRKDWNPQSEEGAFLAYFLRYSPREAVVHIDALGTNPQPGFFFIDKVFTARKAAFPDELEAWFRGKLKKGSADEAGLAAYELSMFGRAEDKGIVEQKFEQLRQHWNGSGAEIETAKMGSPECETSKLEINLVSALAGSNGKVWILTPDEKALLGAGCLTSQCTRYFPAAP